MFSVRLSRQARRFYEAAQRSPAKKLARCFERLEADPCQDPNVKVLKGQLADCYRYRVGDYRIIYTIDEVHEIVHVLVIGHRSEVYK